jgi:hypothetical protein
MKEITKGINSMDLPFTDENLEKEGYKDRCDELATLEVQNINTFFGRWFLDDGLLSTWVCVPKTGFSVVGKLFCYGKDILDLKTKDQQSDFYQLMAAKEWIGSRGLKSLLRAFKYLNKKSTKTVD